MDFKLIFLVIVLSVELCIVLAVPLTTSTFKGFLADPVINSVDDSDIVEVVPNELPEKHDPNIIDLSTYGRLLYGQPDLNNTGKLVAKFKPNTTSVNPEELGSYLEGDILMPVGSLVLKNGIDSRTSRWPDGKIPFEIAGDFTRDDLNMIAYAIDEYHLKTCIRFVPHTTESDYVSILKGNSGCWSAVGRVGGEQQVNLQAPGCLTKPGTVIHELMHVVGFLHEQNRKERDSFVDIQFQNVQTNAAPNFERIENTVGFGERYDYGSVMHYSPTAFSKNGQPTIIAKIAAGRQIMGQRNGFSPFDVKKVNRMYNCEQNPKAKAPPIKLFERTTSRLSSVQ